MSDVGHLTDYRP